MAEAMVTNQNFFENVLNFAPGPKNERTVADLVETFTRLNKGKPGWIYDSSVHPHESSIIRLSAVQAQKTLGWYPLLDFERTVAWTVDWYNAENRGLDMRKFTDSQILEYACELGYGIV